MSFIQKFFASIARVRQYPLFTLKGSGSAIFYLFLLTLTLGTLSLIRPVASYTTSINLIIKDFSNVPDFSFSDGKLSISGEMPYIIGTDKEALIFDTSGKTGKEALEKYATGILFTESKIYRKQNGLEITETDLSTLKSLSFDKATVKSYLPLLNVLIFFIVIFGYLGFFLGKLISALIVAIIGVIIASVQKVQLRFDIMYATSLYALTLPMVVSVALHAAGISVPFFYLFYCAGAAVYVAFAIKAMKENPPSSGDFTGENPPSSQTPLPY